MAIVVGAVLLGLAWHPGRGADGSDDRPLIQDLNRMVAGALRATAAPRAADPPDRVFIPAIEVNAALQRLTMGAGGQLVPPSNYTDAGWYADGPAPGAPGPAVLAGHVDSVDGPAVFFKLATLHPGDLIQVRRGTTWVSFATLRVERYPKDHFPTASVYNPTPGPQLRLITCGGQFDRTAGSYRDNIVVYAVPA